jgi:hypothetical protein
VCLKPYLQRDPSVALLPQFLQPQFTVADAGVACAMMLIATAAITTNAPIFFFMCTPVK